MLKRLGRTIWDYFDGKPRYWFAVIRIDSIDPEAKFITRAKCITCYHDMNDVMAFLTTLPSKKTLIIAKVNSWLHTGDTVTSQQCEDAISVGSDQWNHVEHILKGLAGHVNISPDEMMAIKRFLNNPSP